MGRKRPRDSVAWIGGDGKENQAASGRPREIEGQTRGSAHAADVVEERGEFVFLENLEELAAVRPVAVVLALHANNSHGKRSRHAVRTRDQLDEQLRPHLAATREQ